MTVRRLDSVHRLRYFRFCNVLHIWTIRAIPTYRVYRLYDRAEAISSLVYCVTSTMYYYGPVRPNTHLELTILYISDAFCADKRTEIGF